MPELLSKADQIGAVAAATAAQLNNELTVILSGVADSLRALPASHPARQELVEAQAAANRARFSVAGLMTFASRSGARPAAASPERLIEAFGR